MKQQYEQQFIHIADFKTYFKKRKKIYFLIGSICAFLTMFLFLIVEPKYYLKASFKEATMRSENSSASMLRTLLKGPSGGSGSVDLGTQALSVMKSRQLVQKVVEEMGLQGDIKLHSLRERLCERALFNYRLARGFVIDNSSFCRVKYVTYAGKEIKRMTLRMISEDQMELFSSDGKLLCKQDPKKPVILPDLHISLEIEALKNLGKKYLLQIYPLQVAVDRASQTLKVKVRREDVNFLDLAYKDKDPKRGASFLNLLMSEYKRYLIKENNRIAKAQLEYLTTRQGEIADKLDETLKHHVEYLQNTLGDQGFMGLHQELEMMESKKKRHQNRLLEIELDLNKVNRIKTKKLFSLQNSFLGEEGQHIQQTLLGLKKQKDGLDLAIMKRMACFSEKEKKDSKRLFPILHLRAPTKMIENLENQLEISSKPLSIFTELKEHLNDLYKERSERNSLSLQKKIIDPPSSFEYEKINDLKREIKKNLLTISKDQKPILLHKIHLLNLRENVLKQRIKKELLVPRELEGIDLAMAKDLHVEYVHELDESRLKKRQSQFALDKISEGPFNISSIINLVGDTISQEFVKETMQICSELKNEQYLSEKDRHRLQGQLARKKEMLMTHLREMMDLTDLKIQLIEDKVVVLEQVLSDLVNQDIVIIEDQMKKALEEKTEALNTEKEAIKEKLKELQTEMKEIPRKWLVENRLQLQSDLNVNMMEGMAQLVESKNVEHHLLQVESKAIDEAYIPLKPKHIPIFIYGILGGCLGLFISTGIGVGKKVSQGFPISLERLKSGNHQVAGPFSKKPFFKELGNLKKKDLEVLREIVRILLKEKITISGIILNGLSSYAQVLGQLLVLSGKKTLIIHSFHTSEEEGLLDYLSGNIKEITIEQQEAVHRVSLGSQGLYRVEMLSRYKFLELLQELQKIYEIILIVTDKKVNSSEAHKLSEFCQKMIITLDEESLDDLYPYNYSEERIETPSTLYLAFE